MSEPLQPRILVVIVRYRVPVSESATIQSLTRAFAADPSLHDRYTTLLWDNSAEPLTDPPAGMLYRHDPANSGITGAFNASAAYAEQHGFPWILLLDQDSDLPPNFLHDMAEVANHVHNIPEVAAIAPSIYAQGFPASPHRVLRNRHVPYPAGESGIASGEATAINSGSMLRVKDLLAVGGYSAAFQQEYSDWYIFHQLHRAGKKLWRAANIRVDHVMTVMDYDNLLSVKRYGELLAAEEAFNDLYRSSLEGSLQTLRLLLRAAKQRLRLKNPEFSHVTLRRFFRRLATTRGHRIAAWQADAEARRNRYTAGASN
ncbi:putative glycosyltransferase [Terriglobus roseus DSM 18391]|uniref:Putative glycosyltransferase n=1 Tax=Terriglobus roseus (strain DSM 18391 / NRRL B-41598 / KBS 63) TaxID=926566 RepID=I3ZMU6_TERRK|nr:glycosyltransferase family 2 protein [Terriglobus roseus]AFL90564.1 putative glycosyltransferase [Terriglobus roseus DSM 18391]